MRKVIAVILTVLMLMSMLAAFPVSAATNKTYDGTTAETEGLSTIFISEIGRQMYYHRYGTNAGSNSNSMNFIELYNNGAGDVALDSLSLLQAVEIETVPTNAADPYLAERVNGSPLWKEWRDMYRFIAKMDIKSGKIIDDENALKYSGAFTDNDLSTPNVIDDDNTYARLTNAGVDMTLSNGENAVIWLINQATLTWMRWADNNIRDFDPRAEFVTSYYGSDADPDDYTIVMVWAYSDFTPEDGTVLADYMFSFDNVPARTDTNKNYILGVAKNTWNLATDAAYNKNTKTINTDLYSMTVMGARVPQYTGTNVSDVASVFAPANTTPYIENALQKFMNANATPYADYFAASYVTSYRETGTINWTDDTPTPGSMPDWQWAMVDPANAPEGKFMTDGAVDATKVQAAIDAYIAELKYVDDGADTGRDEEDMDRNYNFETQEEIKNRFQNKKDNNTTDDSGLPTWAVILIIVGGVLVVGGGACAVVFLVVLPKKKAAAAVAEGDAAPAEDTPVEEAPAQEEKKDE